MSFSYLCSWPSADLLSYQSIQVQGHFPWGDPCSNWSPELIIPFSLHGYAFPAHNQWYAAHIPSTRMSSARSFADDLVLVFQPSTFSSKFLRIDPLGADLLALIAQSRPLFPGYSLATSMCHPSRQPSQHSFRPPSDIVSHSCPRDWNYPSLKCE
jgi:hypothetical protein